METSATSDGSYDVLTELEKLRNTEPGEERQHRLRQLITDALADVASEAAITITQFSCLGFEVEAKAIAKEQWERLRAAAEYHDTADPAPKRRRTAHKSGSKDPCIAVATIAQLLRIEAVRENEWYPQTGRQRGSFLDALRGLSRALYCRTSSMTPTSRASIVVDRLNRVIVGGQLRHKKSNEVHVCDILEVQRAREWIDSGHCGRSAVDWLMHWVMMSALCIV